MSVEIRIKITHRPHSPHNCPVTQNIWHICLAEGSLFLSLSYSLLCPLPRPVLICPPPPVISCSLSLSSTLSPPVLSCLSPPPPTPPPPSLSQRCDHHQLHNPPAQFLLWFCHLVLPWL